jgi:hypothetical protein
MERNKHINKCNDNDEAMPPQRIQKANYKVSTSKGMKQHKQKKGQGIIFSV